MTGVGCGAPTFPTSSSVACPCGWSTEVPLGHDRIATHLDHVSATWGRTTVRPVTKPSMEVNISFRVPRALRDAAREKADEREENVSDVLRAALERYVRSKR